MLLSLQRALHPPYSSAPWHSSAVCVGPQAPPASVSHESLTCFSSRRHGEEHPRPLAAITQGTQPPWAYPSQAAGPAPCGVHHQHPHEWPKLPLDRSSLGQVTTQCCMACRESPSQLSFLRDASFGPESVTSYLGEDLIPRDWQTVHTALSCPRQPKGSSPSHRARATLPCPCA